MEKITLREILQKAKRKKISCDINEKTLEMVDEMSRILKVPRSRAIEVFLTGGIITHVNLSIKEWEKEKNKKEYETKKADIEKMIDDIKKFKKKWAIGDLISS